MEIINGYYRLSVKALIFDETRTKFLLVQEDSGKWDLPGGGLDWGEKPAEGMRREIQEEMGLVAISVSDQPCYLTTAPRHSDGLWRANVLYEVTLEHFNFTPSTECLALTFVTKAEAAELHVSVMVTKFLEIFDPKNHIK